MNRQLLMCALPIIMLACSGNEPRAEVDTGQSEQHSEVDSFTQRTRPVDSDLSRRTLDEVDRITNIYIDEAISEANKEAPCDGFCLAMIVSESLARSTSKEQLKTRLKDIREGNKFKWRMGNAPWVPGWRGYQGAIEPLLSKGVTTDGRFTLAEGVVRDPIANSVLRGLRLWDSPGSFVELGSVVPVEMKFGETSRSYVIGSDKFGHFLSTGMEYLETYVDIFDKTKAAGLTDGEADERASFAVLVRGLTTEATLLGGWTSRVFAYGDLSANHAGYRFFKAIMDGTSPYFARDTTSGTVKRGPRLFTWRDMIETSWDEGINCSHYYATAIRTAGFQQRIVRNVLELEKSSKSNLACPAASDECRVLAKVYTERFGETTAEALLSPQCLDVGLGKRERIHFSTKDLDKNEEYYDAMGFYSGAAITKRSQQWCEAQRDALVEKRCKSTPGFKSVDACKAALPRVTSEAFRCRFDATDVAGWAIR